MSRVSTIHPRDIYKLPYSYKKVEKQRFLGLIRNKYAIYCEDKLVAEYTGVREATVREIVNMLNSAYRSGAQEERCSSN